MCVYLYIHNKYTQNTYYEKKLILNAINSSTAHVYNIIYQHIYIYIYIYIYAISNKYKIIPVNTWTLTLYCSTLFFIIILNSPLLFLLFSLVLPSLLSQDGWMRWMERWWRRGEGSSAAAYPVLINTRALNLMRATRAAPPTLRAWECVDQRKYNKK